MALAFVANGTVQATASATTVTATFPASHTATADNLLLAIHSCASTAATTTPTGYTLVGASPYVPSANNRQVNLFVKKAAGGETAVTITQPNVRGQIDFLEISGMSTSDIDGIIALTTSIQAAEVDGATTTSHAAASVDPTQTTEVLMLAAFALGGTPGGTPTWDGTYSYANVNAPITNSRQFVGYKIGTNLGAQVPVPTWTTTQAYEAVHFVIPGPSANATPTPSVVSGSVSISASITASVEKTVGLITGAVTITQPSMSMTPQPSSITSTVSIPSMSAELTAEVTASVISRTVSIPTPTVFTSSFTTVMPSVISRTVAISTPTTTTTTVVAPSSLTGAVVINASIPHASVELSVGQIAVRTTIDAPAFTEIPVVDWDISSGALILHTIVGHPRLTMSPGGSMIRLSSTSTEYVKAPVRVRQSGAFIDPTASTVEFAYTTTTDEPEEADWVTGSWETDRDRYFARVLTGPDGDTDPGDGTWSLWMRISRSPEATVRKVGTVAIS